MKLMIKEDENRLPDKSKYILYTNNGVSEFDNYEDAVAAYKSLNVRNKFLYQPDKRYFAVTLSSTGFEYYKRVTMKANGLFIAKNLNQIKKFLSDVVDWRETGGYRSEFSKYRIYTGGYGENPICSDTDWKEFNSWVDRNLHTMDYGIYYLEKDFGALDVASPPRGLERQIPFYRR